ncbi:MAG: hypothetical protein NVS4B11_15660 [Ktedonobacteraceae bacterium]
MNAASISTPLGQIRILSGSQQGATFQITKSYTRIGRQPDVNDIILTHPTISRTHAELTWDGTTWSIKNLTHANMLTVNGNEIQQQGPLFDRDEIALGTDVRAHFYSFVQPIHAPPPEVAPTVIRQVPQIPHILPPHSDFSSPGERGSYASVNAPDPQADAHANTDPLRDLSNPAWSFISLIVTTVGSIAAIAAIPQGPSQIVALISGVIGLLVGALIIIQSRRKGTPPFPQQQDIPVSAAQHNVFQARHNSGRISLASLFINILFLVIFILANVLLYGSLAFEFNFIPLVIFLLAMLVSFVDFTVRISNAMLQGLIRSSRVLWIAGIVGIVSLLLGLFGINNTGVAIAAFVALAESVVLCLVIWGIKIVMWSHTA